jgi:hypothetical protein
VKVLHEHVNIEEIAFKKSMQTAALENLLFLNRLQFCCFTFHDVLVVFIDDFLVSGRHSCRHFVNMKSSFTIASDVIGITTVVTARVLTFFGKF